ncbi:hypothetical protein EV426DRAFT_89921 [Tirmania nivea]|nr:hypothetical protein EV426DRAFT_89921 [Tirmania nivea]
MLEKALACIVQLMVMASKQIGHECCGENPTTYCTYWVRMPSQVIRSTKHTGTCISYHYVWPEHLIRHTIKLVPRACLKYTSP